MSSCPETPSSSTSSVWQFEWPVSRRSSNRRSGLTDQRIIRRSLSSMFSAIDAVQFENRSWARVLNLNFHDWVSPHDLPGPCPSKCPTKAAVPCRLLTLSDYIVASHAVFRRFVSSQRQAWIGFTRLRSEVRVL